MELLPSVIIIFAAFGGFVLAAYLNHKKSRPEPMVCPLKGDCSAVIKSEFSSFFGIPVEKIGMAYYLAIAVAYGAFLALPGLVTPATAFLAIGASMAAFLFSAYLTFIQIGFLKSVCTWCLLSALLTTVIFVTSVIGSDLAFLEFLRTSQPLIVTAYLAGLALGVGGATFDNVFFFKFLKDLKISHEEASILQTVSQVLWLGLGLVVISGVGLLLAAFTFGSLSAHLVAAALVVTVTTIAGAFLTLKITPHLVHISFGDDPHKNSQEELQRERKIAFALSAVSIVSWYFLLGLTAWTPLAFSLTRILLVYVLVVGAAVFASQLLERHFGRQLMP